MSFEYIDYVNYLKSLNIILYDHDYRISYNNIKTYYNKNLTNELNGGGNNKSIDNIFNNTDELINVLYLSLSDNPQKIFFIK